MAGRPTLCTPELIKLVAKGIGDGLSNVDACAMADITQTTFYEWLQRSGAGESPFTEFSEAIKKAQVKAKQEHLKNIKRAGKVTWQASAWTLERKYPEEFGQKVQHQGDAEKPLVIRVIRDSPKTLPDTG